MSQFTAQEQQASFLFVDNIQQMNTANSGILKQLGAQNIYNATSAEMALKILKTTPVDIVISRLELSDVSGLDLLSKMREDELLSSVKMIMYTSGAQRDIITQAIAAGVTDLLLTPFKSKSLIERIQRILRHDRPAENSSVKNSLPTKPDQTDTASILIVDDSEMNIFTLSEAFKQEYQIQTANNGQAALDICLSDNPPDLMLLDIMMPELNGYQVARKMHEYPNTEMIPIIFITAMQGDDVEIKALKLGAVDFIHKPINIGILKARVANLMRFIKQRKQSQQEYDTMRESVSDAKKTNAPVNNQVSPQPMTTSQPVK